MNFSMCTRFNHINNICRIMQCNELLAMNWNCDQLLIYEEAFDHDLIPLFLKLVYKYQNFLQYVQILLHGSWINLMMKYKKKWGFFKFSYFRVSNLIFFFIFILIWFLGFLMFFLLFLIYYFLCRIILMELLILALLFLVWWELVFMLLHYCVELRSSYFWCFFSWECLSWF